MLGVRGWGFGVGGWGLGVGGLCRLPDRRALVPLPSEPQRVERERLGEGPIACARKLQASEGAH